jgi:hypothetical protein
MFTITSSTVRLPTIKRTLTLNHKKIAKEYHDGWSQQDPLYLFRYDSHLFPLYLQVFLRKEFALTHKVMKIFAELEECVGASDEDIWHIIFCVNLACILWINTDRQTETIDSICNLLKATHIDAKMINIKNNYAKLIVDIMEVIDQLQVYSSSINRQEGVYPIVHSDLKNDLFELIRRLSNEVD